MELERWLRSLGLPQQIARSTGLRSAVRFCI